MRFKKYNYIIAIVVIICLLLLTILFPFKRIHSNYEYKEITDTIFVYRRDTIVVLPYQNIEDIKKNLTIIKK